MLSCGTAAAQDYPTKLIRIIVPFPPGGSVGIISRAVGDSMAAAWGQPVIVDSKPGAGGILATDYVAKSQPDGHTLLFATANVTINAALYKKIPYDTERDLVPVAQMITVPNVIVVRGDLPVTTLQEFIALAKKEPGKLNYSSGGSGSFPHLAFELLKQRAEIDVTHVPFKGNAPALTALLTKDVDVMSSNIADILPHTDTGLLRPLAVTGITRSETLPAIPTVAEAGFPDFATEGWMGIFAPRGTPPAIVDKLNRQIVAALHSDLIGGVLKSQGFGLIGNTPAEFAAFVHKDLELWARAVQISGATAD
jgi:tripartite-type tricarboxylate transporter receptor subunit TctC